MISDYAILRCWEMHEAKRVGRRLEFDRTSIEDTAVELRVPYERVRDLVLDRLAMGFGG